VEPSRGRLHEIDLLRILAAVSVMAYHYLFSAYAGGLSGLHFPHVDVVARYGYLGVDLFFTISGFVAPIDVRRCGSSLTVPGPNRTVVGNEKVTGMSVTIHRRTTFFSIGPRSR